MRIFYKYLLHSYWHKFTGGLTTDYSYASYVRVVKLMDELKVLLTSRIWCALSEENRLYIGHILCSRRKFAQYARILDDNGYNAKFLELCDSRDDVDGNMPNFSCIFDGYEYASNLIRSCGDSDKVMQNKTARMLVNKQIAYCDAEISLIHSKIMAIMSEVLQEQHVDSRVDYLPHRITSICSLLSGANY